MSIKDAAELSESDQWRALRAIDGIEAGQLPEFLLEFQSLCDQDSTFPEHQYRRRLAELELFRRWFLDQDITYRPLPLEMGHEWRIHGRGIA